MKKNILFFYCLLVVAVVSLKAQEIRPMPADSAYGVVHISVCNMRDEGKFTSGMSTQALLGMPVKVLQYTGWYEIQTPDDYTGWVHRMVVTPMSKVILRKIAILKIKEFFYPRNNAILQKIYQVFSIFSFLL